MTQMIALVISAVFDGGLHLAGMTNPSKIVNFLDIVDTLDPSLISVLGGRDPISSGRLFHSEKV